MAAAKVVRGRVGRALQEMGNGDDVLVRRGESVPLDFAGPILVCTRNDDLEAVLQSTLQSRWSVGNTETEESNEMRTSSVMIGLSSRSNLIIDLNGMIYQSNNGMLEPWFHSKGLGDADQVLAYFAISKLGEPPIGKTATNPEGLTAAFGKWASAVAARLHAGGLSCKDAFQKQMLEKLIWILAFMLVGARHPGATVGVVEKEFCSEVRQLLKSSKRMVFSLVAELAAAADEKGIAFENGMEDRLCYITNIATPTRTGLNPDSPS
ncbi:hypothetical protein C3L33_14416, partial [Rhododendron williamsianum]